MTPKTRFRSRFNFKKKHISCCNRSFNFKKKGIFKIYRQNNFKKCPPTRIMSHFDTAPLVKLYKYTILFVNFVAMDLPKNE